MKVNLKHITFIIPFFYDSPERLENLECVVKWLNERFDTNILVWEVCLDMNNKFYGVLNVPVQIFCESIDSKTLAGEFVFHRTKVLNQMIEKVKTKYLCVYDTDVILSKEQILESYYELQGGAQMVYPYDGRFVDIERSFINDGWVRHNDSYANNSLGGAVFFDTKTYKQVGGENENIIGWGPEDAERYERMKILGCYIVRVPGFCYHIKHPVNTSATIGLSNYKNNVAEFEKVKNMPANELKQYISAWPWLKNLNQS